MVGWVLVVDTPYYARTPAATGKAQLDNVPSGTYTPRTWHARLPAGTEVRFPNHDTVRHHVYSLSPAKNFEPKL